MPLNEQGIGTFTFNDVTYDIRPYAHLERVNLTRASLRGANLRGANLRSANLRSADLTRADLRGADLSLARLMGAELGRAHLAGADLRSAMLDGADLRGADLENADLTRATLDGADLTRAHLRGANLEGVYLGAAIMPQVQPQPVQQPQGRAYEIHNAFDRLNIDQFMSIIENHTLITNDNNGTIFDSLVHILTPLIQYVQTKSIPEEEKQLMIENLTRIQDTILPTLNDPTNQELKQKLKKVITYVLQQPPEFIDLYLKNYTFDCLNAYNPGDQSCVKGMIERIVMIIRDVVVTICSKENIPLCKPEYTELKNTFYPEIDINHLFQEWFNANNENNDIINIDPAERKSHFINFVRQQITPEQYNNIQEKLNSYIEQNHATFETLTLGGKKKRKNKTAKKQTRTNIKKTKSNKRNKPSKRKSKQIKKNKK